MSVSRLSWMAVAALAATLGTAGLMRAAPAGDEARPKAARTPGNEANAVRERVRERLQQLAKELNLTEAQKTELRPVLRQQVEKLKALRADASLTREQKQEKLKALRGELRQEMKRVLTAEQWEKWQKLRQGHSLRQQAHPKPGTAPADAK